MAKRFTDSEKWQDNWFTELTNDQKVIWIYLLDHCDNAGIWKMNMKNLNYFCSTNISVEYFIFTFQKRLTRIDEELFIINKFCLFQYGPDFLTTKSKPVLSALDKLTQLKIVEKVNNIYTLSIPLPNPYLGTKDKEEDKEQDKEEYKEIEQGKDKGKEQDKEIEQDKEQELVYLKDKIKIKGWNSLPPAEAARYYILRDLVK